jgi:hypothetical protein
MVERFDPNVPMLWGDSEHDDRRALSVLFRGGAVYCMRSSEMIAAPTMNDLPPGNYRMVPPGYRTTSIQLGH